MYENGRTKNGGSQMMNKWHDCDTHGECIGILRFGLIVLRLASRRLHSAMGLSVALGCLHIFYYMFHNSDIVLLCFISIIQGQASKCCSRCETKEKT